MDKSGSFEIQEIMEFCRLTKTELCFELEMAGFKCTATDERDSVRCETIPRAQRDRRPKSAKIGASLGHEERTMGSPHS